MQMGGKGQSWLTQLYVNLSDVSCQWNPQTVPLGPPWQLRLTSLCGTVLGGLKLAPRVWAGPHGQRAPTVLARLRASPTLVSLSLQPL